MSFKRRLIGAGFDLFRVTRVHRLFGGFFRGSGVILMFHRICPAQDTGFAPNAALEITPEFLDSVLECLRENGFEIVTLDEAVVRSARTDGPPFAALTFDDGFRDVAEYGLPVLRKHNAPFCFYITSGFADRSARAWWVELEEAIRRLDVIDIELDGARLRLPARDDSEKQAAFAQLSRLLGAGDDARRLQGVAKLCEIAGVDSRALIESLCLDWNDSRALADDPLVTLGAHSLTHPRLALLPEDEALAEVASSRERLEQEIGRKCRHFAYPYGGPSAAGQREFDIAKGQGFVTAVTTRQGMIFPENADRPMALPRLSVSGLWQDIGAFETMLSGLPVALRYGGRRRVA